MCMRKEKKRDVHSLKSDEKRKKKRNRDRDRDRDRAYEIVRKE